MKRIGNSKEPTPARMLAIASNLQTHLNTYIAVTAVANFHDHSKEGNMEYSLWIASVGEHKYFQTWPELLEHYRKIMKEGLDSAS